MKAAIVQLKTTINDQLTRIVQIPEAVAELNVESYSMGIQAEQLCKEALTIH